MPRGSTDRDDREVGGAWSNFQRHWFGDPSPGLAPFVTQYWLAAWDLRGQPPFRQLIVPSLNVHLSFVGDAGPVVRGVGRRRVFRTLDGIGRAFGVAFRPGCFRPFLKAPVSTITGRSIPARAVFGSDLPEQAMAGATDEIDMASVIEQFLLTHLPGPDPTATSAAGIVARVSAEPDITRVDALADVSGISVRGLQRLFAEHVGIGPKWVIRHYRLTEVTRRMAAGTEIDWAGLAIELGYADQAHFTSDFAAMVG